MNLVHCHRNPAGSPPAPPKLASVRWIHQQSRIKSCRSTSKPLARPSVLTHAWPQTDRGNRSSPTSARQPPWPNPHSARGTAAAQSTEAVIASRFAPATVAASKASTPGSAGGGTSSVIRGRNRWRGCGSAVPGLEPRSQSRHGHRRRHHPQRGERCWCRRQIRHVAHRHGR